MVTAELERRHPKIEWREPVRVVLGNFEGWACRFCIAQYGIRGHDYHRLMSEERARAHIAKHLEEGIV